jgi:hypothetical protein
MSDSEPSDATGSASHTVPHPLEIAGTLYSQPREFQRSGRTYLAILPGTNSCKRREASQAKDEPKARQLPARASPSSSLWLIDVFFFQFDSTGPRPTGHHREAIISYQVLPKDAFTLFSVSGLLAEITLVVALGASSLVRGGASESVARGLWEIFSHRSCIRNGSPVILFQDHSVFPFSSLHYSTPAPPAAQLSQGIALLSQASVLG